MKAKHNVKTSATSKANVAAPALIEAPPARAGEGDVATRLSVNSGKTNEMQPTLVGLIKFGDLVVDLSAWWQETLNKQRDYYSLTLRDAGKVKEALQRNEKPEPLSRLKLYQFRQNAPSDPDYISSTPFTHEDRGYWALMWVDIPENFPVEPTEADLKRITYHLVFSTRRPSEKWERGITDEVQSAQAHLMARRRELEERKLLQARRVRSELEYEADEIP